MDQYIEISGRVYTNLGKLLDTRLTDTIRTGNFPLYCEKISVNHGYHDIEIEDSIIKIKVDSIKKI